MLALLVQRWDEVAPWLVEPLFADETNLGAFRALAEADGDVHKAIEHADPEVRDLLERVSVADVDADSQAELRNLVGAATRRELEELRASRDLSRNAELVSTDGSSSSSTTPKPAGTRPVSCYAGSPDARRGAGRSLGDRSSDRIRRRPVAGAGSGADRAADRSDRAPGVGCAPRRGHRHRHRVG